MDFKYLQKLAKLVRYYILISTTEAGSGHMTSSLSAVELTTALLFSGTFKYDPNDTENPNNDRLIFSKGHASPLLYSLWAAAGKIREEEMLALRKFGSPMEGHPRPVFKYAEAATGSLGQGLSIGLGMALAIKIDSPGVRPPELPRAYVLLGDSEIAEGSCWEAMQLAAHYKLKNLIGIIDVNRLGQRGETMYGHDLKEYQKKISAFGWETIVVNDGHSFPEITNAYRAAVKNKRGPVMIIAKTIKGKGVSFLENKNGWHGKTLSKEELRAALKELGEIDKSARGEIAKPPRIMNNELGIKNKKRKEALIPNSKFLIPYKIGDLVATRKAYGNALARIFPRFPNIVVLDAEVKNSTYSEIFEQAYPERFFEMFIAEQNMVGAALGLARRGKIPFVSTFAAFFTRAFDQIRMSQYSDANIKFCGSHSGVSIGEDGPSQMGLEDIAMFRTLLGGVVLYPADAVSCEKLVEKAAEHRGLVYIRTNRPQTPVIYDSSEDFPIGKSKVLRFSSEDKVTVVAAGITVFEALAAQAELLKDEIKIRVIDCYSIKPIDEATLRGAAQETQAIITVEDHFAEGGLGEAVNSALAGVGCRPPIYSLAVRKIPGSGKPQELLDYEKISKSAIIKKIKEVIK